METITPTALTHWESFYVIVGSSAAALTGLMFVVMTLISDSRQKRTLREIDAFGTPTVVHYTAVLLISAVMSAPWVHLRDVALAIGASALAGIVYAIIVLRRVRGPVSYKPVLEDWIWHLTLPSLAYVALFVGAIGLNNGHNWALYAIGAVALLLLFVGIHNAWDTVTYMVVTQEKEPGKESGKGHSKGS